MKYSSLAVQELPELAISQKVKFPAGIVGFPDFTEAEIVYKEDQLPFMWLQGMDSNKTSFIVVEPAGLVKNYEIEISDADVAALGLKNSSEAFVLNIAALHKGSQGKPDRMTLNLIGPIIVNRRTLIGRQIVINNSQKYSVNHLLFEASGKPETSAATV